MSPGRGSRWEQVSTGHRRFLLIHAIVVAAVVNAVMNALLAWLSAASEESVPLWAVPLAGGPSIAVDTVGTFFVLPLLTTLVVTTTAWREMDHGKLARVPWPLGARPAWMPATRLRRGAVIGAVCAVILGPPAVAGLVAIDFGGVGVDGFVLYKAVFGVLFGAVVTPLIALLAFSDERPAQVAATA